MKTVKNENRKCQKKNNFKKIQIKKLKREVEESGRPRRFWKPEFASSNLAFPTETWDSFGVLEAF